jgi:sugar phosphate isomerase/epimerase
MKINQIAAQLYTLRDFLKTPADIATTLQKVRQLGYQAVQVSGMGPIEESELNRILAGEGLLCCATHENSDKILNETAQVIDRLQKLNCKYTAYPWPAGIDFSTLQNVLDFAARLDKAGKQMRKAGQVLTYHNHATELQPVEGKPVLDWIYAKTRRQNLQGEIDTFWIQNGGGDPVAWCRKLKRRLPLIHLKDYTVIDNKPSFAPVGHGNLNMPAIVKAAETAGCEWFIVEQDDCYGGDPFEALGKSYRYLETLAQK